MAVITDYPEDQQQQNPITEKPSPLPFNANLDPSNPLNFLEFAFNFVSRYSDLFKTDSAEEKIVSLVRSTKQKAKKAEEVKKRLEAEDAAKKATEKERKKNLLLPNNANGVDMEDHSWGQSRHEVNVTVPVTPGTKSKSILCEIKKNSLKVGIKGENPIIDGALFESVKPDDCFWSLEDNKAISVFLTKTKDDWWNSLLKGGPQIDVQKAEPEPSRLDQLDPETRSVVEKMMFDQKQQQLGLPTSDEIKNQEMLKQFMAQNPKMSNMDFSGAKFM